MPPAAEDATPMDTSDAEAGQVKPAFASKSGLEALQKNIALLEKGVQTNQLRLIGRVLRNNFPLRHGIAPKVLAEGVKLHTQADSGIRQQALEALAQLPDPPEPTPAEAAQPEAMEVDSNASATATATTAAAAKPVKPPVPLLLPETEVYLATLAVTACLRLKRLDLATSLVTALVGKLRGINRRTMDALGAKVFFYFSHCHELAGKLADIRPLLISLHRTACLHHDDIGQATLLNLILRNLLHFNLMEQASNVVAKTRFPEGASNNQLCRYLYYVGRIQAIQLDYTEAFTKLNQASRKAPQDTALGFRRAVHKLLILVQLLMGEIPDRAIFAQADLRAPLAPYFNLTMAVRLGNLHEFHKVVEANAAVFKADKTYTLILRLGHNVIKTGLRKISLSYSRISLADIASKLTLDDAASAEFVCAKAIRDGVIEATIDHDKGYLQSREITDVYATLEPQQAFHRRITFCLDVHNEAVKSMRFPANNTYKDIQGSGDREEKTEEELANEIESELEDGF